MAGDQRRDPALFAHPENDSMRPRTVDDPLPTFKRRIVMTWIVGVLSVVFSLTFVQAGLPADFEGVIHMKNTSKQRTSEMDWYAKGEKGRMEMQMENGRKIFWIV